MRKLVLIVVLFNLYICLYKYIYTHLVKHMKRLEVVEKGLLNFDALSTFEEAGINCCII
jgi:hypothetical protein